MEVPRFHKLCQYVSLFGEEGGFEVIAEAGIFKTQQLISLLISFSGVEDLLQPAVKSQLRKSCAQAALGHLKSELKRNPNSFAQTLRELFKENGLLDVSLVREKKKELVN